MSRSNRGCRKNFTLLEMVAVLGIFLLVSLLVVTQLSSSAASKTAESRISPLHDMLLSARRKTLNSGKSRTVDFDSQSRTWSAGDLTWSMPSDLRADGSSENPVFAFHPDGTARLAEVRFILPDGESATLGCSALTGVVFLRHNGAGAVREKRKLLWEKQE